jgi:hypothetical protein
MSKKRAIKQKIASVEARTTNAHREKINPSTLESEDLLRFSASC